VEKMTSPKVNLLNILLWVLLFCGVQASADRVVIGDSPVADMNRLVDPVQDAKDAFQRGESTFVGIQLHDSLETPGVTAREIEVWSAQPIEPLNTRWQSFANIEEDRKVLLRLRQYANRYNLMMLKLLKEKRRSDTMRYRY
jgi:hypothetical protein